MDVLKDTLQNLDIFIEVKHRLLSHHLVDRIFRIGVSELVFRLRLELRVRVLDRYDRNDTVSDVLSIKVIILALQKSKHSRILIHDTCKRRLKSSHKRTAVGKIDPVTV